ncbi:hypothetical protein DFS34DRAFT_649429 [Phlyctochytrium arcticum]|nr:hypothetical protein DFS34DRAFT_649429 [Phlyctochytrium arcticum]
MPADHQTAMFSATLPTQIQMMAAEVLVNSVFVTVNQNGGWNVPLPREPTVFPMEIFVDDLHRTWNVDEEIIGVFLAGHADVAEDSGYDS